MQRMPAHCHQGLAPPPGQHREEACFRRELQRRELQRRLHPRGGGCPRFRRGLATPSHREQTREDPPAPPPTSAGDIRPLRTELEGRSVAAAVAVCQARPSSVQQTAQGHPSQRGPC